MCGRRSVFNPISAAAIKGSAVESYLFCPYKGGGLAVRQQHCPNTSFRVLDTSRAGYIGYLASVEIL